MSTTLLLSTGISGAFVLLSYAVVLADVVGMFPLPVSEYAPTSGYLDSHYWLNMPRDTIVGIIVMQVLAGIGFVIWVFWLAGKEDYVIEDSLLSTLEVRITIIQVFLWASTAWPFFTHYFMLQRTLARAILASIPLWIAATAIILLIGGTFEARAPALPTLSILFLGNVVVLADGVGWAAVCIKGSL